MMIESGHLMSRTLPKLHVRSFNSTDALLESLSLTHTHDT